MQKGFTPGFTLIELMVVIAIVAILSSIVMFSVVQYINKGKDSNVAGNLATLIPAGEVWYTANGNSYSDFCEPSINSVMKNVVSQMPENVLSSTGCYSNDANYLNWTGVANPAAVCCSENTAYGNAWAACAQEFANTSKAYCVDSRGVKQEIDVSLCQPGLTQCED